MAVFCPLFSSSSGNCIYIGASDGGILIDAGASAKSISAELSVLGTSFENIRAIAVTHTHSDHTKGLKTVLKKTGAKLLATSETLKKLEADEMIPVGTVEEAVDFNNFIIGDTVISNFPTSHDCPGSCGYSVMTSDGKKISVCTDLGYISNEVHNAIIHSDAVLIESNHDVEMLKRGPYPPLLKKRILSDMGHISNIACATEVMKLFDEGTMRFILGHLSRQNNTPELAASTTESVLFDKGIIKGKDYLLTVANPESNGVTVL